MRSVLPARLEAQDGNPREADAQQAVDDKPRQKAVVCLGLGGEEEDAEQQHRHRQIEHPPFPSRLQTHPCRERIGAEAGHVPSGGRQQDARVELGGKHALQIDEHQQEVRGKAGGECQQAVEQHEVYHPQLRIGQVQRQLQAFVIHLGDELHQCQQDARQQGDVLQQVHEDGVAHQHHFPDVGGAFQFDHAIDAQHAVSGKARGDEESEQ